MHELITSNLDLWTSALLNKSNGGRNGNGKQEAYGIKKLRELILELAVRGKLVPQDTNDEPASILLERIATKKLQLLKERQIRKQEKQPVITDSEKPFYIPDGWEWVRLGEVIEVVRGITFPASEKSKVIEEGRIACLRTTNIQDRIEWDDMLYVRREFVTRDEQFIRAKDIVMSTANSRELVGKVAIVENEPDVQTAFGGFLTVLRPILLDPYFVMVLLRTPVSRNALIDSASQTTNIANISIGKLNPLILTVPPLAEQHRIVAKVDELMILCDLLEQQQTYNIETHQAMVETLLGTLTSVVSPQELAEAWTRISKHFDILFTSEHSIDQLKQTILQLAVMGKLVSQDPDDEPASMLIGKIAKEKERLFKEGKIKKQETLPVINEDEKPFELPEGWVWVRLGEIVHIRGGKRISNGYQLLSTPTPYIYIRVSDMKDGSIDDSDLKYIDEVMYSKISQYIITKDDIYMTIVGATIGKCGLVPDKFDGMNLTENAARLTPYIVSKTYLYKVLSASFCQDQFIDKTKQVGVQKMALNRLASTIFPLTPLAEQHRIVAKVDEVMALCDALKARLADAQATQNHLADAIVEQAVVKTE